MDVCAIKEKIGEVHNGSFVRVIYVTVPSQTAESKKSGVSVTKLTSKLVRFGVNYANIASVVAKRVLGCQPTQHRKNNYVWDVKNIIATNSETGETYVQFANAKKNGATVSWMLNGSPATLEEVAQYIIPSYFKGDYTPEVQKVNIKNIIKIGK